MILLEFVAELKEFEVLQSDHIHTIRNYIQKKYPTASTKQQSIILADAINKVIDICLLDFNKGIRDQVKYGVLQRAAINNNYNISGSDIFRACLFIKDTGENFNASLINWLTKNCCTPIKEKHIDLLLTKVADSHNEYFDYELEYIISRSIPDLENDNSIIQSIVIDTSSFEGSFVERVCTYEFFKEKIIIKYIPYHIIVAILLLSASLYTYLFIVRPDNRANEINPPMIFAELQYKLRNDGTFLTQDIRYRQNYLNEQLMYKLQYRQVDKKSLIQYLSRKGSLLCEEPYYSSIIQASIEYNLNPLLLFAIAGQEQSFVPRNARNAQLIANNPFNVYGSWQVYNTNILDSSRTAANLIVTLNKNRPPSIDPIVWINTKYAEDKKWNVGVKKLLEELEKEVIVERDL